MTDILITNLGRGVQVAEGGKTATYTVKLANAPSSPVTVSITTDDQTLIANGNRITRHTAKVMSIGDSITYGVINSHTNTESGGYRNYLWKTLQAEGYRVNFVGSQSNGPESIDRNHEGYRGQTIKTIANSVHRQLVRETPNVILLLAGTNDINQNVDIAQAPKRLSQFVDQILRTVPNAAVLVGTLPPNHRSSDNPQQIREFNAALRPLFNRQIRQGKTVQVVDLYSFLKNGDLTDQVHPNARGYRKIARSWYETLVEVLDSSTLTDLARTQTLTFTPQNWNVGQTITVAAVGDQQVEGVHYSAIRHTVKSSDAADNTLSTDLTVTVTDNDSGVVIRPSDGDNTVEEGGRTDTYQIALTHKPTANVLVELVTSRQLSLSRSSVTFTPTNWRTPRTIEVSAVDDVVIEGSHTSKITHSVHSRDVQYQIHDASPIVFNIVDHNGDADQAGLLPVDNRVLHSFSRTAASRTIASRTTKTKKPMLQVSSFNRDNADRLLHVNQQDGDRTLLNFNQDPITQYKRPAQLLNAGMQTGMTLEQAAASAYSDVNVHKAGNQALQLNQAVMFEYKTMVYVSVNFYHSGFQAQHDPMIALGQMTRNNVASGNRHPGLLTVTDYFM